MKLYYAQGACSLATHIALLESGLEFDLERVDLQKHVTAYGADFMRVNAKGYVPVLVLDSGETITENVAVLDWIAAQSPGLGLEGPLGRTRVLEALAYISSEIHKGFKPYFASGSEEEKARAQAQIDRRLRWLAERMVGPYLFGEQPTVADFYLFVMLRWTSKMGMPVPAELAALHDRLLERSSVQAAITAEEHPHPDVMPPPRTDSTARMRPRAGL